LSKTEDISAKIEQEMLKDMKRRRDTLNKAIASLEQRIKQEDKNET